MANRREVPLFSVYCLCLSLFCAFIFSSRSFASQNWHAIDQELARKVLQVNVGLKVNLQNNLWVQVADISSKKVLCFYYYYQGSWLSGGWQGFGFSCFY